MYGPGNVGYRRKQIKPLPLNGGFTSDGAVNIVPFMITETCRDHLLDLANEYRKKHDVALATVSKKCHGNCHFLDKFGRGKISVTIEKYDQMLEWFAKQSQAGAELVLPALKRQKAQKISVDKRTAA